MILHISMLILCAAGPKKSAISDDLIVVAPLLVSFAAQLLGPHSASATFLPLRSTLSLILRAPGQVLKDVRAVDGNSPESVEVEMLYSLNGELSEDSVLRDEITHRKKHFGKTDYFSGICCIF